MKQKIDSFEKVEEALLELFEVIKRLDNYAKQIKDDLEILKIKNQ